MSSIALQAKRAEEKFGINMTPMIDVTFQLIIFFMVVATMSRLELEANLKLPFADMAIIEETPDANRLVINVDKDEKIIIYGKTYTDVELENHLKQEAARAKQRFGDDWRNMTPVLIRCDQDIRWSALRIVLDKLNAARFYRVQMGAYSPESERKPD
ncbi:MAG TPA: biopolymer transporter ExbD [Candidatus Brocadiia bacterium]|nr:biopolymer transporter ExbD [Candidatus Brocadiia bacterium]